MMRVLCSYPDRFLEKKNSIQQTILAGRYFANECRANMNNHTRGLDEFALMQNAFDRLYPGAYNIIVYRKAVGKKVEAVYHGNKENRCPNKENRCPIPIIWLICEGKSDFFGLKHQLALSNDGYEVSTANVWDQAEIFNRE